MIGTVLFDVDDTLVDSNDSHAHAWVAAFHDAGISVPFDAVRRCIGMGGDKLMPEVSGIEEDSALGARIAARRGEIFRTDWLPRVKAFPDADRLAAALHARGLTLVAASSAKKDEMQALLGVAGVLPYLQGATSSDDAEESKPDPDIVVAALKRAQTTPDSAVLIGDTPYDLEAAHRAGVAAIAFRCGGWRDSDLGSAVAIYDGPWDLLENLAQGRVPLELRG